MTARPPPFTSWPTGKLRPVEQTSAIDASELAWFGVLDGRLDFSAPPWTHWIEREIDLWERQQSWEALRPVRGSVHIDGPAHVRLELQFTIHGREREPQEGRDWRAALRLAATPCPFGGRRWWFLCPTCDQRRARLYRRPGRFWECRVCAGMTYESRQSKSWRRFARGSWRAWLRMLDADEARIAATRRRNLRRAVSRWRHATSSQPIPACQGEQAEQGCLEGLP